MNGAAPVTVIGVGNPLRGDDGVGPRIARALRDRVPAGVRVLEHAGEAVALIERWRGSEVVVLVDCVRSGAAPGSIHRTARPDERLEDEAPAASSHGLGVGEAIELARALGRMPRRLVIYGIEGSEFDLGRELSAPVRNAIAEVTHRILEELGSELR